MKVTATWIPALGTPVAWKADRNLQHGDAPRCTQCKVNPQEWDSEPGAQGYTGRCNTCFWVSVSGPLHLHTERYTPVQEAANGFTPGHTWQTSYRSYAVFGAPGVQTGWACSRCDDETVGLTDAPYPVAAV